jgi:hypothetical protein
MIFLLYHKAISFVSNIKWFFSLVATLVGCCVLDLFFCVGLMTQICCTITWDIFCLKYFVVRSCPTFLGHWLQCYRQPCCTPPCVGKLWILKQGIHHLVFQPTLESAFFSNFVHLRCSIHLGIKITHIGTYASFHQVNSLKQFKVFLREPLTNETSPSQVCHYFAFLHILLSPSIKCMVFSKRLVISKPCCTPCVFGHHNRHSFPTQILSFFCIAKLRDNFWHAYFGHFVLLSVFFYLAHLSSWFMESTNSSIFRSEFTPTSPLSKFLN